MHCEDWIADAPWPGTQWRRAGPGHDARQIAPGGAVLVNTVTGEVHPRAELAAAAARARLAEYQAWAGKQVRP